MQKFNPDANDDFSLSIETQQRRFRVMQHPAAPPGVAHMAWGKKAKVYRVMNLEARTDTYALKVFSKSYQDQQLEQVCLALDNLKRLPGLVVCERRCLSPATSAETLEIHPNLRYAILMPWIQGQSWFDVLSLGREGKSLFSKLQSLQLASNLAKILHQFEENGIAHCDLSAANLILDPGKLQVELIDVEEVFAPGFQKPTYVPLGTRGYQHRTSKEGQWHAKADRFAGAILIAEMLGWYDPRVRAESYGESYFDPAEMQTLGCRRFDVLSEAVSSHDPELARLLKRAWESQSLDECPTLTEWHRVLSQSLQPQTGATSETGSSIGDKFSPFWTKTPPSRSNSVVWAPWDNTPNTQDDSKSNAPKHGSSVEWIDSDTDRSS